jgi:hypothetical protein
MVSVFLSLLVVKENNNAGSYENTYLFEKLFRKLRRDFCSGFSVSAIGQKSPVSALMRYSKKRKENPPRVHIIGRLQNNFQDHRRLWKNC